MASFVWQARSLVKFKCHFSWQAQYLVKFKCHFSWQVQHCVKFGIIAGARNVVFFNGKCSWRSNLACEAGCGVTVSCHSRIILGSCSDRSRIVNDVAAVFEKFL